MRSSMAMADIGSVGKGYEYEDKKLKYMQQKCMLCCSRSIEVVDAEMEGCEEIIGGK